MDGGKRRLFYDGGGPSGTGNLVEDVLRHFRIRQPGEVIVHGDALAQGLMEGLFKGTVEAGLPAEGEREAV